MEWWQENPIEGATGVRAVTGVKELNDALPTLLEVSKGLPSIRMLPSVGESKPAMI